MKLTNNITNMLKSSNMALDKLICATKEERINTKRRYNNKKIYNYLEIPESCFNKTNNKQLGLYCNNKKTLPRVTSNKLIDVNYNELLKVNKNDKTWRRRNC